MGEGRNLGERSLVLIRDHHVLGYGYTKESEDKIQDNPEAYLTQRFKPSPIVDGIALRYLRVLKNLRSKTESWRSLALKNFPSPPSMDLR